MVVTLFKGSPVAVREQIADELGVSTKVLDSWLVTINTVRNYRDGRSSDIGTISQCWEVDPNVYSSDSARPWHSSRMQVKRAVFDSDFANAGMTNFAYFFHSVMSMTEVAGFQRLAGLTNVSHMFTSCNRLETIWATSFDHTTITRRPARWTATGGSWGRRVSWPPTAPGRPPSRSGPAASSPTPLRTSAWAWGHLYDTGALEISASTTPDAGRTVVATGRVCTNAHYLTAMAMPWYDGRASLTSCAFLSDLAGSTIASIDYWFYSMTTLVSETGWANVHGLASLK